MEIGSEFSTNSLKYGQNEYMDLCSYPKRYVLSGRTGLYMIAQELRNCVTKILLPDYCCGSMVAPFVKCGFDVTFYQAFTSEKVDVDSDAQVILIMDYFGFLLDDTVAFAQKCKNAGKIVIVDATQTAFSHSKTYEWADYIISSYRKWFDSLCAVVYSKNGFCTRDYTLEYLNYREIWRNAAEQKRQYLEASFGDKTALLSAYSKANHMLDEHYIGMSANKAEIEVVQKADSIFIRNTRRRNAAYLIDEIKKLSVQFDIELLFDKMGKEDCPLFVPIFVSEDKRDLIRNELIRSDVFCPVHWPIDQRYPYMDTEYRRKEISLLCDQRYGIEAMEKQILVLSQALKKSFDLY